MQKKEERKQRKVLEVGNKKRRKVEVISTRKEKARFCDRIRISRKKSEKRLAG